MNEPGLSPASDRSPDRGFVRHDLFILVAIFCLAVAVVGSQALKHGLKGALVALLGLFAVLAAVVGVLSAITWFVEPVRGQGPGWRGSLFRWVGHLLRFSLFGLMAAGLGAGLVAEQGLSAAIQNLIGLASCALGGGVGSLLYHRLGPTRFWPAFGWFCLTLLASFLGGILGILGPERWGVAIGILIPLVIFALLVAFGRIVPGRKRTPSPSSSAQSRST